MRGYIAMSSVLLLAACYHGPSIYKFRPVQNPNGIAADLRLHETRVRGEQEERLLPRRALAEGVEHAVEMPQDATLPLQGRVGELEERIHVLMIVEAQPEQLVLPTPCVDRDGTYPHALRRLSRREQRTDLGLRLVAVPPSALQGGLPPCVGDVRLTGSRSGRSWGK